ncbi:MAG TPA: deoxyguanosinetriphosphate triphosphohydrolase [Ruminococcaceae bacterium]|nr:deoxyguanosinetriphosphate triphosphohydrolase [Oscillospiraceae bacterium]
MTIRERSQEFERQMLSTFAAFSSKSRGREREEKPCDYRTDFQRDRDRILHSKAFRRLKHKTQVFLSPEGDHYRTRLTHTLEVAQVARTISRALLLNEDLTEAISLGHDLGHTPFGHAGERALNDVMEGGFRHYEQSVRVVEQLENDRRGLNLTWEVRDGILHHTCGDQASTLEGSVVRISDRIAYINHDIDDAIRAGVLSEDQIPAYIRKTLGDRRTTRIDTLVTSIVENSGNIIMMDSQISDAFDQLHNFMFEAVYHNPVAKGEEIKVDGLIKRTFEYYVANPQCLPYEYQGIFEREGAQRAVCDYIAGMTDNYLLDVYHHLFIPRSWEVKGINFTN